MPEELVAVAMSGGVDSSVAAAILREQGKRVAGFTMRLWDRRRFPELAPGARDPVEHVHDASAVAERLSIPFHVVTLEDRFEEMVVEPFVEQYLAGRTPIPCARCNRFLKFGRFLELAAESGARRIATGHYARIRKDARTGRYQLLKGVDPEKDQSYFLFGLTQEQLSRTLFPVGELTKEQVRAKAAKLGLPVAEKKESQEICFIPNGDYAGFIDAWFREKGCEIKDLAGEIVDSHGNRLGEHAGVHRFTVGQRKGLGIAVGKPLYVLSTEASSRRVVVGDDEELFRDTLVASEVNWVSIAGLEEPRHARVRIRHKHSAAEALIRPTADASRVEVCFEQPQRAVTPGQAAVFYDGDLLLGGGWID